MRKAEAIALIFLVWAIIATSYAYYYFGLYVKLKETIEEIEAVTVQVNLAIDYGNGTRTWFNDTLVRVGTSVFGLTKSLVNVKYTYYEDIGVFVTGIEGVYSNQTHGWTYWYWNVTARKWELPLIACDRYIVQENDIVIWFYAKVVWPPTPPE